MPRHSPLGSARVNRAGLAAKRCSREHVICRSLVPACAVAEQHGVGARHDLGANLSQMLVHRLGVGRRHDDGSPDTASGADGAKQIGGVMTIVSHHERARTDWRPDVGMAPLLADTCFVLKPDLDRRAGGAAEQLILQQGAEVFLNACSAAGSFFGWTGRGCSRVRPNWGSHLPTVLSCTCTEK